MSNTSSRARRFASRPGTRERRRMPQGRVSCAAAPSSVRGPAPAAAVAVLGQPACTSPISTRTPDDAWMLSVASRSSPSSSGSSLGETPDQSVTRPSLELNVPIGTQRPGRRSSARPGSTHRLGNAGQAVRVERRRGSPPPSVRDARPTLGRPVPSAVAAETGRVKSAMRAAPRSRRTRRGRSAIVAATRDRRERDAASAASHAGSGCAATVVGGAEALGRGVGALVDGRARRRPRSSASGSAPQSTGRRGDRASERERRPASSWSERTRRGRRR